MHDEFLKALRRDPPPQFARRLKQQLHAQEARSKRRSWSMRILSFLIFGSAFAGGMIVVDRHSPEKADPTPLQAQAQRADARPGSAAYRPRSLGPGFVPEGSGAASQGVDESQPSTDSPANNFFSGRPGQPTQSAAAGAASTPPEQTTSGGLIRARAAPPGIAISPLADALVRSVLGRNSNSRSDTPRLETTAADPAFSGFCAPGNERQFDVVVSSRRISYAEFMNCRKNGIARVIESKLGYQALVLTNARDSAPLKLSLGELYLGVAKQIPDPADPTRLIVNTNFTWDQVNGNFAYRPIAVFGPMRETPLRVLFETLLLEPGCNAHRAIEALQVTEPYRHAQLCRALREDRLYTEVEQTANLIPQNLWSDPHAFVLVDYRFYLDNQSRLAGSALAGPEPSYATFADGTYPLARPVYIYVDETRMDERTADVYDTLHDLQHGPSGPNRHGFVRVDNPEAGGYRSWRRKAPLTVSDLTSPRSAPR